MAANQTMDAEGAAAEGAPSSPKGGRKKLILGVLALLVVGGAGADYATGLLGKLTGGGEAQAAGPVVPGSVDLPEIMANLNVGPRRTASVRLKARLELATPDAVLLDTSDMGIGEAVAAALRVVRARLP